METLLVFLARSYGLLRNAYGKKKHNILWLLDARFLNLLNWYE